jgi:hypothetical protein
MNGTRPPHKQRRSGDRYDRVRDNKVITLDQLTTIQKRMLRILEDGEPHSREELHKCLQDELASLAAIQHHLDIIKRAVSHKNWILRCVLLGGNHGRMPHYQMFRRLSKDDS